MTGPVTYLVLAAAALITSVVSGILGMGGGIMLLSIMFCFLSHADSIPTHAAVQIASNGTRALAFLKNVDERAFLQYIVGLAPGAAFGALLLWQLGKLDSSEPYLKVVIGLFILAVTYLPARGGKSEAAMSRWSFSFAGLLAGTAALTVGAVGPLIAPFFTRCNFVKERLIATKAVCQLATHILKIPAFLALRDLDVTRLGGLALIMICMVIPGTLLGKRLLRGVSEHGFVVAYRVALTLAGLKVLFVDGLAKIPW